MRNAVRVLIVLVLLAPAARAGYTHYWTWRKLPEKAELEQCAQQQRRLIEARAGMLQVEGDPPPGTLFAFNGKGEQGHEPLVWPGREGFNFCKTAGKPYDEAVTAVLIAARDCFGPERLAIGSDGEWEEWAAGAALYRRVLGKAAQSPLGGELQAREEAGEPEARAPAPARRGPVVPGRLLPAVPLALLFAFAALYLWDRARPRRLE